MVVVAITGSRGIGSEDNGLIELAMIDVLGLNPTEIVFGGARGADTEALVQACIHRNDLDDPTLTVIVPGEVVQQPKEAAEAILDCSDKIMELRQSVRSASSYHARNREMVDRADLVVAFWDGVSTGTRYTMDYAMDQGKPVEIFQVGYWPNPLYYPAYPVEGGWCYDAFAIGMPICVLGQYVKHADDTYDELTQLVRDMKLGTPQYDQLGELADRLSALIKNSEELQDADAIVPMPRRLPGLPFDLEDLTEEIARQTGIEDGTAALQRRKRPKGGKVKMGRERFSPDAHSESMRFDAPDHWEKVILFDNVLTTGSSLEGARMTVEREGIEATGLAIVASGYFQPPEE